MPRKLSCSSEQRVLRTNTAGCSQAGKKERPLTFALVSRAVRELPRTLLTRRPTTKETSENGRFPTEIRTKREQPSMGWKVASMTRRTETFGRNELACWSKTVFHLFPQTGLRTIQRFVNICVNNQGRPFLRTYVRQARNAVHPSVALTGYSAARSARGEKCPRVDLEYALREPYSLSCSRPQGTGKLC